VARKSKFPVTGDPAALSPAMMDETVNDVLCPVVGCNLYNVCAQFTPQELWELAGYVQRVIGDWCTRPPIILAALALALATLLECMTELGLCFIIEKES